MAAPGRPGERVLIHLRFLDEAGAAVTRTVVDLWQGDETHPCALEGDWDPVLFASLRSGDSGTVAAETTLPLASGHVPGGPASSHLHVSVERTGFDALRGLLVLGDDAAGLASEGPAASSGTWIAKADPKAPGRRTFRAELRLKRTP